MKLKIVSTHILIFFAIAAFGQSVENDDMYFNSKDRVALREHHADQFVYSSAKKAERKLNESRGEAESANPTDSYSSRNVNPEFSARSNAESAQEDNQDYYLQDYKYQNAQKLNNWNSNFNNWYGNSMYNSGYYSPGIYGWNSPYYGSYYDSWGNPWNNPYYQSGYSSSFSYYMGNNWNYGWGMNYNYGSPYNSFWGPSYSYGYGSPWSSYYGGGYGYSPYRYGNSYPATVIVNEPGNNAYHSKRNSRSSYISRTQSGSTRLATTYSNTGSGSRSNNTDTGRVRDNGRANQQEYYNRTWRNQNTANTAVPNTGNTNGRTRASSWGNQNSSGWNNSGWDNSNRSYDNGRSNNSSYSPSRSSSGFDGGSRSFGGGGSGSGSRSSSSHGRGGH